MFDLIKEADDLLTENEKFLLATDYETRRKLTDSVCWFLPSVKNINLILDQIEDKSKVIDIGCGSGILGKYILANKKDVIYNGVRKQDEYDVDDIFFVDENLVTNLDKNKKIKDFLKVRKDDTWIMSWPPYKNDMAYQVLKAFYKNPNVKKLIYIGEIGGCNGDEDFYDELSDLIYDGKDGYIVEEHAEFDTYAGLHDYLVVVRKKD